ncbi:MAG: glutamate--tRNA ligase family protein [Bacteroidota bacterium]
MESVTSRIAPTPSGFLHQGNGLNFVLTWLITRLQAGKLILRIDDLDQSRVREEYLEDVFHTLDWLGIDWDKGPVHVEDHLKNHSQRHRIPAYLELLKSLKVHSFACQCSRKEVMAHAIDGQYAGTCRSLNLRHTPSITALRIISHKGPIHITDQIQGEVSIDLYSSMRDFVVFRKDGIPAYQLASLSDDMSMGVNLIVRGIDLLPSSAAQIYLAQKLERGFNNSVRFYHHKLIQDEQGQKLSKSKGSTSLKSWRETRSVEEFYHWVGSSFGIPEKLSSAEELLQYSREKGIADILKKLV